MAIKSIDVRGRRSLDVVMAEHHYLSPVAHPGSLLPWRTDRRSAWPTVQAFVFLVVCLYSDSLSYRAFG